MESHGWIFWLIVPFFFIMMLRRRHSWDHFRETRRKMKRQFQQQVRAGAKLGDPDLDRSQDEELEEHRHYIDELEKRVAELENRLDFTERLLSERRQPVAGNPGV